jgi:hypothetical protein
MLLWYRAGISGGVSLSLAEQEARRIKPTGMRSLVALAKSMGKTCLIFAEPLDL